MTNHSKKRNISRSVLIAILVLTVALSLFMLTSCGNEIDVASISVVEDTLPQNIKVSEFDISQIKLTITDSKGVESPIPVSETMLTTESRNMLKEAGTKEIIWLFQKILNMQAIWSNSSKIMVSLM